LIASFFNGRSRLAQAWLALGLAAAVTVFDVWYLGLPLARYFVVKPQVAQTLPLILLVIAKRSVGVVGIALAQAAFFWASLSSPRGIRILSLACFAIVTFVQYGFVAALGAPLNVHDLAMAAQTRHWGAVSGGFFEPAALAPVALYALALLSVPYQPARWYRAWMIAAVVTILVHGTFAVSYYVHRSPMKGDEGTVTAPMSTFQALFRTLAFSACDEVVEYRQPVHREMLAHRAATVPDRHILLVVDESMSALHLSLNGYSRPTTPWLEELQRQGRITNWGPIAAASNFSSGSVCVLLTGFNSYPDTERRILSLPTIFQFAKAMNYRTHLFDGEQDTPRYTLRWDDLRFVDDWRTSSAFGDDPDTDVRIARATRDVLKEPQGQFVVILKRGNHEPPELNYPAARGPWHPSRGGTVPPWEEIAAATNSYDNAVLYNLDPFFKELLSPAGELPRTVGIYTSDHAEALGADGGTPFVRRVAYEEATVPLVFFGDDRPRLDTRYAASHANIFATLLDLMHVPDTIRTWKYGRSLLVARAADHDPRPVLGGYMFGHEYPYVVREYDELKTEYGHASGSAGGGR
jgi:glucan phosphoethanolaminetransferase (alkaline phosphatase superfamily)